MFESLNIKGSIILENKAFVLWLEQVYHHSLENRNSMLIILTFSERSPRKGQRKSAIEVGQQTLLKVAILCPGAIQNLDQKLPPLRSLLSLLSQCL